MRPVNLIPSEQRRDARKPMRSGPLAYVVVGALVAALAGITLLVLADNQISDRKSEVTTLEARKLRCRSRRRPSLAPYTQFHEFATSGC